MPSAPAAVAVTWASDASPRWALSRRSIPNSATAAAKRRFVEAFSNVVPVSSRGNSRRVLVSPVGSLERSLTVSSSLDAGPALAGASGLVATASLG